MNELNKLLEEFNGYGYEGEESIFLNKFIRKAYKLGAKIVIEEIPDEVLGLDYKDILKDKYLS